MTNHMHVAGYYPEAYEGKINYQGKEYSIAEIATSKEMSPILKRHGDWVVTKNGVEHLKNTYVVGKNRLNELDWISHMEEKTWININDFTSALGDAEDFVRLEII